MLIDLLEKVVRYPRISAVTAAIILIAGGGFLWWQFVWQNPQRAFTDMLANNLAAYSVTRVASAQKGSQGIDQYIRQEMGSTNATDWLVTVRQGGSSVTTESIGTPTTGYIRYTNITTGQRRSSNTPYNFKNILSVWAKSDGRSDTSLNQLFSQTVIDISSAPIPPIGNLPVAERADVLNYIRDEKIFTPSYKDVKRETINGRSVYTYQVAVQLGAYVRMMQAFAHDLGITSLDTIDPSQYSTVPPVTIAISVDRVSHQLSQVTYQESGFTQSYRDWGLVTPIQIPHASVTTTQLQQRIQALNAPAS